jgi:hypothetical protein
MASQAKRLNLPDYSKAFAPRDLQMPTALRTTGKCPMHETRTGERVMFVAIKIVPLLCCAGEEMQEARTLAKQHLKVGSAALTWEADDVPQPLTEAAVSSFRQRKKLAGLHLQDDSPDPPHQV